MILETLNIKIMNTSVFNLTFYKQNINQEESILSFFNQVLCSLNLGKEIYI